jgi:hypothetical protein
MNAKQLLRRNEAAQFLTEIGFKISRQTLARAAVEGWSPRYVVWGRHPLYAADDLLAWARDRAGSYKTSTSSYRGRR